jgi:biotin operon repressor
MIGDTYEALILMYRQIQADHGLTPLGANWSALTIPDALRPTADWFFRGDIALAMNLLPFACSQGWHSLTALTKGLQRTDSETLATVLLRSPDATMTEHRRRDREVARVLTGSSGKPLLTALDKELFDTSAAAALLDDPSSAKRALVSLLRGYQKVVSPHDLTAPLRAEAPAIEATLTKLPLDTAARKLFPQFQFDTLTSFKSVTVVPSLALAPFLSTRLTTGEHALIIFPILPPTLDLVAALKALAHPQRLEILRIAAQSPVTGHTLAQNLGLTEATIHHHTSLLRGAGLLTSTRDANQVHLTTIPGALNHLFHQIQTTTGA